MKIHVEVFIASRILGQRKGAFSPQEVIDFIDHKFRDQRSGVRTHTTAVCVANAPLNHPTAYNYLLRTEHATLRVFKPGIDLPSPGKEKARVYPEREDVPEKIDFCWPSKQQFEILTCRRLCFVENLKIRFSNF